MIVLHVAEVVKGGVASVINELLKEQQTSDEIKRLRCLVPDAQRNELNITDDFLYTFRRNGRNIGSFLSFCISFIKVIYKEKPTIVHLHSTFAGLLCRLILLFAPRQNPKVIYCPHAFSFMMSKSRLKVQLYAFIEKFLSSKTDAIICVSDYERNIAQAHGIKESKMVTIYNGVTEPQKYENYKLEDGFHILYVGRFDYQKGFDRLINVISGLNLIRQDITFTVIGDFVSQNDKHDLSYENCKFTGWLPKNAIVEYYKRSDILIIPSRWEGLAMVPLESFSCQLPVIASSCSSFPEIITDGYNGYLVDMDDTDIVIDLLQKIATEKKSGSLQQLSLNAYKTYMDKFSAVKMNAKVFDLYRKITKS